MRSVSSPLAVSMITGIDDEVAQLAAEIDPGASRQHQVEDDQVDDRAGQRLAHLPAVAGAGDAVAVLAQEPPEQGPHLAVVVDDEDVRFPVHTWSTACCPKRPNRRPRRRLSRSAPAATPSRPSHLGPTVWPWRPARIGGFQQRFFTNRQNCGDRARIGS